MYIMCDYKGLSFWGDFQLLVLVYIFKLRKSTDAIIYYIVYSVC